MTRFAIKLKTISLTYLGWSHPSALGIDVPFIKRGTFNGKELTYEVYMPGSSLKGALRSAASRVSDAYGYESCKEIRPELIEQKHDAQDVCDVCKLFGYPKSGAPSPLMVSDLKPMKEVEILEITRVRIDDSSLKASEGALFAMECIPPDTIFEGKLILVGADQKLLGLLLLSLAELRMDRFGRHSIIDLIIEDATTLREELKGTPWLTLVDDLKEWLWE